MAKSIDEQFDRWGRKEKVYESRILSGILYFIRSFPWKLGQGALAFSRIQLPFATRSRKKEGSRERCQGQVQVHSLDKLAHLPVDKVPGY